MAYKELTQLNYTRRMNESIEYIYHHLNENLNIEVLAEMSNYSPFHYSRIFKEYTGQSILDFVNGARLCKASEFLRYTELPIKDIAYSLGYDMPTSLTRLFKCRIGATPIEYRRFRDYWLFTGYDIIDTMDIDVDVVRREQIKVIYLHCIGLFSIEKWNAAYHKLRDFALRHHVDMSQSEYITEYHNRPQLVSFQYWHYDVCLSIPNATSIILEGEIGIKTIDGGRYMTCSCHQPIAKAVLDSAGQCIGMNSIAGITFMKTCFTVKSLYDTIYEKLLPLYGYYIRSQHVIQKTVCNDDGNIVNVICVPIM